MRLVHFSVMMSNKDRQREGKVKENGLESLYILMKSILATNFFVNQLNQFFLIQTDEKILLLEKR